MIKNEEYTLMYSPEYAHEAEKDNYTLLIYAQIYLNVQVGEREEPLRMMYIWGIRKRSHAPYTGWLFSESTKHFFDLYLNECRFGTAFIQIQNN